MDDGQTGRGLHVFVRAQVKHHRVIVDAAKVCQQLGVAGVIVTGPVQRLRKAGPQELPSRAGEIGVYEYV